MTKLILRVLIDTNIWISGFINPFGAPARVLQLLTEDRYRLVVSHALLAEVEDVVTRPHIRRRLRAGDDRIDEFLRIARTTGIWVEPTGTLRLCRDPNDDIILETALLGNATHVVSRDDDMKRDLDLIANLQTRGVEVVSVAQFLTLLEAN